MAPLVTHLVVGERVFAQLQQFDSTAYGPFLLGCVLVDVNGFIGIDRRVTHFVGRLHEDGRDAFGKSCDNFLEQLDTLLIRPWRELQQHERAFVAGYLCHLAVDEVSKQSGYEMLQKLGISSLADLPVPGGILLSAFAALTSELHGDFSAIALALENVSIPHVLVHVLLDDFRAMWEVSGERIMNGCPHELRIEMLRRMGKTNAQIEAARHEHETHWDAAVAFAQESGEVERIVDDGVRRSLEVLPRLRARSVLGAKVG
jgi:hypothetical protein